MSYVKTVWKDRLVEKPMTFKVSSNLDGTVTLERVEGNVTEEGTSINAANMNKIENAIGDVNIDLTNHIIDMIKHVTSAERNTWNAKAGTSVATTSTNGLLSSTDKTKLDGIASGATNYVHPATHPASIIVQDSLNRFITDAQLTKLDNTNKASGYVPYTGGYSGTVNLGFTPDIVITVALPGISINIGNTKFADSGTIITTIVTNGFDWRMSGSGQSFNYFAMK